MLKYTFTYLFFNSFYKEELSSPFYSLIFFNDVSLSKENAKNLDPKTTRSQCVRIPGTCRRTQMYTYIQRYYPLLTPKDFYVISFTVNYKEGKDYLIFSQ